jgi:hypothetical protein
VQSYQKKRQSNGYLLQEQEPQAKTGLIFKKNPVKKYRKTLDTS